MITSPLCKHNHPLWSTEPCASCLAELAKPVTVEVTNDDFTIPDFLWVENRKPLMGVPTGLPLSGIGSRLTSLLVVEPPPDTAAELLRTEIEEKKKLRAQVLKEKREALKREKDAFNAIPKSKRRWDTRRSKWVAEE